VYTIYFQNIRMTDITEKYINMVIRRPQYGKTSICMESIKRQQDQLHIIMTMNTLKSNNQFFDRCKKVFSNDLVVFNSKPPSIKEYSDIQEYKNMRDSHASNVLELKKSIIKKGKNIIIMCCHPKRFKDSINELLDLLSDSKSFKQKICIHIDEIHEYIKKNRMYIEGWNENDLVKDITGYSATPFKVWGEGIWKNVYIVEIIENNSISTSQYFGVKDAEIIVFSDYDKTCIDIDIPDKIKRVVTGSALTEWYTKNHTFFDCGDEQDFLSFVKTVLSYIELDGNIRNDRFSYNFIPAYKRKSTHFGVAYIIEEIFPNSVVFIFNSEVNYGNRYMHNKKFHKCSNDSETSIQIAKVRKLYPNSPFFVTGFINVNMSVTLINEELGNFDNVFFSHSQYISKQPEILYQMCRFVFRYSRWSEYNKQLIKCTNLWCSNQEVIDCCLNYENDVINAEKIGGSLRTIEELTNNFANMGKRIPAIRKHDDISKYVEKYEIQEYPVYNKHLEDVMWNTVREQYKIFKGKYPSKKSIPSKNDDGWYTHVFSTTIKGIFTSDNIKSKLDNMSWHSNFQLVKNTFKYARIYVGYKNMEDQSSYTIFLRMTTLVENDEVRSHLLL